MIIARYDAILDQSERAHLYNHLSNYTNRLYSLAPIMDHLPLGVQMPDNLQHYKGEDLKHTTMEKATRTPSHKTLNEQNNGCVCAL